MEQVLNEQDVDAFVAAASMHPRGLLLSKTPSPSLPELSARLRGILVANLAAPSARVLHRFRLQSADLPVLMVFVRSSRGTFAVRASPHCTHEQLQSILSEVRSEQHSTTSTRSDAVSGVSNMDVTLRLFMARQEYICSAHLSRWMKERRRSRLMRSLLLLRAHAKLSRAREMALRNMADRIRRKNVSILFHKWVEHSILISRERQKVDTARTELVTQCEDFYHLQAQLQLENDNALQLANMATLQTEKFRLRVMNLLCERKQRTSLRHVLVVWKCWSRKTRKCRAVQVSRGKRDLKICFHEWSTHVQTHRGASQELERYINPLVTDPNMSKHLDSASSEADSVEPSALEKMDMIQDVTQALVSAREEIEMLKRELQDREMEQHAMGSRVAAADLSVVDAEALSAEANDALNRVLVHHHLSVRAWIKRNLHSAAWRGVSICFHAWQQETRHNGANLGARNARREGVSKWMGQLCQKERSRVLFAHVSRWRVWQLHRQVFQIDRVAFMQSRKHQGQIRSFMFKFWRQRVATKKSDSKNLEARRELLSIQSLLHRTTSRTNAGGDDSEMQATDDVERLLSECIDLRASMQVTEQVAKQEREAMIEFSSKCSTLTDENAELRRQLTETRTESTAELSAVEIQKRELKMQMSELQTRLVTESQMREELVDELTQKETEVRTDSAAELSAVKKQARELQLKVSELQAHLATESQMRDELVDELAEKETEIRASSAAELSAVKKQKRELQVKVTELQTHLATESQMREELVEELARKETVQRSSIEAREVQHRSDNSSLVLEVESLSTQLRGVQSDYATAVRDKSELEDRLQRIELLMESTEVALEKKRELEKESLVEQFEHLQTAYNEVRKDQVRQLGDIRELQGRYNHVVSENGLLLEQLKIDQQQSQDQEDLVSELSVQLKQVRAECLSFKHECQVLRTQRSRSESGKHIDEDEDAEPQTGSLENSFGLHNEEATPETLKKTHALSESQGLAGDFTSVVSQLKRLEEIFLGSEQARSPKLDSISHDDSGFQVPDQTTQERTEILGHLQRIEKFIQGAAIAAQHKSEAVESEDDRVIQTALTRAYAENEALKDERTTLAQEKNSLSEQLFQLQQAHNSMAELVANEARHRELDNSERESLKLENSTLQSGNAEVEKHLEQVRSENRSMSAENATLQSDNAEVAKLLEQVRSENQSLAENNATLQSENAEVAKNLEQVRSENRSLSENNARLTMEMEEMMTEAGEVQHELESQKNQHQRLQLDYDALLEMQETLKQEQREMTTNLHAVNEEFRLSSARVEETLLENQDLVFQLEQCHKATEQGDAHHSELTVKLQRAESLCEETAQKYRSEVSALRGELDQKSGAVKQLTLDLAHSNESFEALLQTQGDNVQLLMQEKQQLADELKVASELLQQSEHASLQIRLQAANLNRASRKNMCQFMFRSRSPRTPTLIIFKSWCHAVALRRSLALTECVATHHGAKLRCRGGFRLWRALSRHTREEHIRLGVAEGHFQKKALARWRARSQRRQQLVVQILEDSATGYFFLSRAFRRWHLWACRGQRGSAEEALERALVEFTENEARRSAQHVQGEIELEAARAQVAAVTREFAQYQHDHGVEAQALLDQLGKMAAGHAEESERTQGHIRHLEAASDNQNSTVASLKQQLARVHNELATTRTAATSQRVDLEQKLEAAEQALLLMMTVNEKLVPARNSVR